MLAQHLITKPVFDTLFQGNKFTSQNAVSKAMEGILNQLYHHNLDKESETLEKFYESVKRRAADIMTATGRQKLLLDLYDRFFRNAFTKLTQRLGIVYTPVEVVDFIIHSVNDVLQDEFGKSLDSKNVHILDPFTGTGTFITRLIQSGFISKENLPYKYKNEIHANEIVLLAYYIAAINIEAVYQDIAKENQYQSFNGIVLTDTFQMYEQDRDMIANLLPDNSNRRTSQKKSLINVIFGNPPYSAGQASANDDAQNIDYPNLDTRIEETYVAKSSSALKNKLYDSYIRAIRWASDRLGEDGVISFVCGAAWIDRSFADGMRASLMEEFSKIYVIHLRGDVRKDILSKEDSGEGENIFGQGSMTGICIVTLVKNKKTSGREIFFCDLINIKKRESKVQFLKKHRSINGLLSSELFVKITPDESNDWINQGNKRFLSHISIGSKVSRDLSVFKNYSLGMATNRDAWIYNFSKKLLVSNMKKTIDCYNSLLAEKVPFKQIKKNEKEIKWSSGLETKYNRGKIVSFQSDCVVVAAYRPFTKTCFFYEPMFIERQGQMRVIFPKHGLKNRLIGVAGVGSQRGFSVLMTDVIPDIQFIQNAQFFPIYLYDDAPEKTDLFGQVSDLNQYSISEGALAQFREKYNETSISYEQLFYYIYGLLHSPEYREMFQNNLSKELPRIPAVKSFDGFVAFAKAGRKLGDLHVCYETVDQYAVEYKQGDLRLQHIENPTEFYRVTKMRFGGVRSNLDKTTVFYNENITITNIPLEAYEYVVNGKSALEWVMERQSVKIDKDSGIVNDANDYANETMNNPAYPLELFQRMITVSLETMKIVKSLPKLEID